MTLLRLYKFFGRIASVANMLSPRRIVSRVVKSLTGQQPSTTLKSVVLKDEVIPFKTIPRARNYSEQAGGVNINLDKEVFKLYQLEKGPETSVTVSKEEAQKLLFGMQLIRRMENTAASLYRDKIIRGFCHLYQGEEAVCVGMRAAMRNQDNCIGAYRVHGWCYVMGISVVGVLAELAGRITGCARGKGGSMHMYAKKFYGGNGIVGAQVSLGTGIAFASKYRKEDAVCIALYGDGAANQGQVFESYNLACLWKIPVVYVVENNLFGLGTAVQRAACCTEFYTRGFYIPGLWVDGQNVLAVRSATNFAIDYVLKNGPMVVEMETYRYMGHSMSDPGVSYRSREEIQKMRETRDPIVNFKKLCLDNSLLTEQEMEEIDKKAKVEVDAAAERVRNDSHPELKELCYDLYSKNLEGNIRGVLGHDWEHKNLNNGGWNVK